MTSPSPGGRRPIEAAEAVLRHGEAGVRLRDWRPADVSERLRSLLGPARPWHETNGPYFGRPTDADAAGVYESIATLARTPVHQLPSPRSMLAIAVSGTTPTQSGHTAGAGSAGSAETDGAGVIVGAVTWYWEDERTDWRRMGVVVYDEAYWGRGVGGEALRLWTSYLFETTGALRLDLATYSGNPAMVSVARRLGFVEEGRMRAARRWSGGVHDALVFGVLRPEWERLTTS